MKGTATLRSLLLLLVLAVVATFARGAGHRAAVVATPRAAGAVAATPAPPAAQQVATVAPSKAHASRTTQAAARTAAPAEAGMWIYKDPETGTIGPRPAGAEPASSINPLNDSDAGLVQVQLPDGSYMVDLQGRFQDYYVLEMTPSGQRVVKCVQNPKEAHASGAVAPQPEDR
jgi:hypothetical protein